MADEKKSTKQARIYDVKNMIVTAWGHQFAYWRYDVTGVPDEVKEYALKGFVDDLQDCTTAIRRSDYPRTPEGEAAYQKDCLNRRRELEKHINEGTKPPRGNANPEKEEDKRIAETVKTAMKETSLTGLLLKKALRPEMFTEEDNAKLAELLAAAAKAEKAEKGKK